MCIVIKREAVIATTDILSLCTLVMSSVEEFNCILCKESFDNKDELQIHFRKHGDPKFNESIKSKSRVQNVAPVANEQSNDAPEMVNCDVCDEVFPTISKAITHKHKLHPEHDAKYFCPWCGKLFTMKHLYNKHLQTNHDAVNSAVEKNDSHFHCDSCDVFFFVPAAMVYHNKFFHRQDTELPIIGHSKKQKLFTQELLPVYYCSFCGEEYVNKVNLHKHICDEHNDENQRPTDVLRCPLCEAIFYHLDAYELHLTFHSSEDLYSETNEMNETDISEFSLETVPPAMERIEDLNNLADDETSTNAVGIESFLQMAMDESQDGSQHSKKTKKHKKHKKSKKSAITLDEFLNMNQDVFGEDLDFQGIEEVPTKVIKRQLKPKKPQPLKTVAKFASSADLKKLQKQGIVVKMKPGARPAPLKVKPISQTVNISPHAKNVTNQTIKAISASNEVLSKLMNQSNNQLKIVKKAAQEKVKIQEEVQKEVQEEAPSVNTINEVSTNVENMDDNDIRNIEMNSKLTPISTSKVLKDNLDGQDSNASESNHEPEIENDADVNTDRKEFNNSMTEINSHIKEMTKVNDVVVNDTLKNISSQITIKPVTQCNKARMQDKPAESITPNIDNNEDVKSNIHTDTGPDHTIENTNNETIDTLKSINSAITIKSLKNKTVGNDKRETITQLIEQNPKQIHANISEGLSDQNMEIFEKTEETNVNNSENAKEKQISTSSSQVLKNLSKNITIKSSKVSPPVKQLKVVSDDEQYYSEFEEENEDTDNKNINKVASTTPVIHKNINLRQNVKPDPSKNTSTHANMQTVKKAEGKVTGCDQVPLNENSKISHMESSNNLLKNLKNITAKPFVAKNIHQQITARSSTVSTNIINNKNSVQKSVQKNEVSEEIEIFNIDDSDSDGAVTEQPKLKLTVSASTKLPTKPAIQSNATLNAIKNISKHITIKSSTQAKQTNNIKKEKVDFDPFSDEDDFYDGSANDSHDDSDDRPLTELNKVTHTQSNKQKTDAFQSVFKNLGKHITIKSKNASPSMSLKSMDHGFQDSNRNIASNGEESDAESCSGKVKITEVTEDNISDDDVANTCTSENKGVVVQSPENSNSGNEHFPDEIEEPEDNESKILGKDSNASCSDLKSKNEFLRNISKNITVKSLSERTTEKQGIINTPHPDRIRNQSNFSKDVSIKPIKQKLDIHNESVKFRSQNPGCSKQNSDTTSPCRTNTNPKHAQLPGAVNVNKEVKVKTYQSETVIEEITTTVTKTIRRVNQVNQQVFNASQPKEAPRMIQHKNGPRMGNSYQPPKNFQGVTVRQPPPIMCPKIRQTIPFRPRNSTSIRPSNQLVPIRPNVNLRPVQKPTQSNPRMQVKNMANQQKPIGKPLKISPTAMTQNMKRPAAEETSGPFSCFKKAKESLIPVAETALESGSDFHYASTSQINKFSSTTKTVKDNTVVTSKQMKSESTSQQLQMSRNSNVCGLKIIKAKQVSEVEKTEMSASKRTTLEAIEKLQKQGLLVKKPRVEEECEPPDSEAEDHDDFQDED